MFGINGTEISGRKKTNFPFLHFSIHISINPAFRVCFPYQEELALRINLSRLLGRINLTSN